MSFTINTELISSNYAGDTKKTTASGLIFAGWAAGLIVGPREIFKKYRCELWLTFQIEFFLNEQAPTYELAFKMLSRSKRPLDLVFFADFKQLDVTHY